MHRSGRRFGTALAVSVLFGVSGCGNASVDKAGGAKPLPAVTLEVINTRSSAEMAPFVQTLTKLSGGALRLSGDEKFGNGSTSAELDAIQAVRDGNADLAVVPARAWHEAGVTAFDALVAPMAVDSMGLQQKVLAGTMPSRMLASVSTLGLVGIGILPGPMRKPAGITRTLMAPRDLRGATVAISRSEVADHAFRTLGASPVPSPFEGAALTGDDGIEQQVGSIAGNQYDGVVRSITVNVNLWPRPNIIVGNAQAMKRLSGSQLGQLQSAAHDALDSSIQALVTDEAGFAAVLCRRGKLGFQTATADQVAAWRSAFGPVDVWLRQDSQTGAFLDEIAALRNSGVQPLPGERLSCESTASTSSASAQPSTPFDGVYEMDTSEADGQKSDPKVVPENWGHWVFVFGGGRFAFTQENRLACGWGYGTYTVAGSQVEWRFTGGGGKTPTGATTKLGEEFVFDWNRYRDTMTLSAVSGAVSPDIFYLKPWHRLSSSPSGSFLSKRCLPPPEAMTW